jgi:hypothetical protein
VKIDVTFSGLDPRRLAEHVERRLRERRASRAAVTRPRSIDEDVPPSTQPPRPAGRRPGRDRRS